MTEEIITKDLLSEGVNGDGYGGMLSTFVVHSVKNSSLLPYWWSEQRESYLRKASLEVDIVSSIINNLTMRLFNMPLQVVPDNNLITSHQSVAKFYQAMINNIWIRSGELFINDMLTFDKGAFFIIESTSSPSQPLGLSDIPTGLKYIPSQQIMLNDNATYPYIFMRSTGGNLYLHESRVIRLVQMPVTLYENAFVGLSFASRAFNVGQLLASAITYGLESLGKISSDNIIWATSTTSKAIQQAFKDAQIDGFNSGNSTKGENVYIGLRDPQGKLGQLELKRLPSSFDYEKFTNVAVKLLAIAAGVDENDIIAVSNAGTTKSATLISELKAKFKLEAWFTKKLQQEFQAKFLPSFLRLQVGEKGDNISETEGKARINLVRSDKLLAEFGALDDRTARQNAVKYGLITPSQFEEMELTDGRLANGLPVSSLFFLNNEMIKSMLDTGIDVMQVIGLTTDKTAQSLNIEEDVKKINQKIAEVMMIAVNTSSQNVFSATRQCMAALNWLLEQYESSANSLIPEPTDEEENEIPPDGDTAAEETNDNLDPSNKKKTTIIAKQYTKPTTKRGRERQSKLRQKVRNVWSSKSDKLVLASEELKNVVGDNFTIDSDALTKFIAFVNQNRQDTGMHLSDLYDSLDDLFDYDV